MSYATGGDRYVIADTDLSRLRSRAPDRRVRRAVPTG